MIRKKEINENTRVERLNRNNFSYWVRIDGQSFKKDALKDIITTRIDSEQYGYEDIIVGHASNKKEFVDEVYDYLNG